jgi:putative phosphoribosyl transferase
MYFVNRFQAGRFLAAKLPAFADRPDVLVLALPRGGVPVAHEVAAALHVPWDVLVVRKLGLPGSPETAMGALAWGGVEQINSETVAQCGVSAFKVREVIEKERTELKRREQTFRDGLPFPPVRGKTVILVDDGLATGATMQAAIESVRRHDPAWVVSAVPVGASGSCEAIMRKADETVCAHIASHFTAVGDFYRDFRQPADAEIKALLRDSLLPGEMAAWKKTTHG